jgi:hypothetical protein
LESEPKEDYDSKEGTVLRLPLERTAIEQINYAQWLYGGRVDELLHHVKELEYNEDNSDYIKFNYTQNTFTFSQPKEWLTDEFFFFFDYIKEMYLSKGYRVTDAIKESKTGNGCYKETERYILIDSITHHLIKLEIISIPGQKTKIVGWGYPTDEGSSSVNQPLFFRLIKELFEKQY